MKKAILLLVVAVIAAIAQQTSINWSQFRPSTVNGSLMAWINSTTGFDTVRIDPATLTLTNTGSGYVLKANAPATNVTTRRTSLFFVSSATPNQLLPNGPAAGTLLDVYRNGVLQAEGVDYTYDVSTTTVIWTAGSIPVTGDLVVFKWFV